MFNWIAKIALGKAVSRGTKAVAALFAGDGLLTVLQGIGISVTIDENALAAGLAGVLLGMYEFLRNWLKSRGKSLP